MPPPFLQGRLPGFQVPEDRLRLLDVALLAGLGAAQQQQDQGTPIRFVKIHAPARSRL